MPSDPPKWIMPNDKPPLSQNPGYTPGPHPNSQHEIAPDTGALSFPSW